MSSGAIMRPVSRILVGYDGSDGAMRTGPGLFVVGSLRAKSCWPSANRTWTDQRVRVFQMTSVRMRIARNTLCALCTAIPIQALRYRFVGYAVVNISRSVPGIAHGTCRW
jgi:hypothetical protein